MNSFASMETLRGLFVFSTRGKKKKRYRRSTAVGFELIWALFRVWFCCFFLKETFRGNASAAAVSDEASTAPPSDDPANANGRKNKHGAHPIVCVISGLAVSLTNDP